MSGFQLNSAPKSHEAYVESFLDYSGSIPFAVLKLYVNMENTQLVSLYEKQVSAHNAKIRDAAYPDAGFDLFIPNETFFQTPFETHFVNLEIKAEMLVSKCAIVPTTSYDSSGCANTAYTFIRTPPTSTGYYIYPRSSISKTPLMLANQTGIIDSGYRGNLITAIRHLSVSNDINDIYELEKHTRLFQIIHPELLPIYVCLVDENELSSTARADGGFGSTGKIGVLH